MVLHPLAKKQWNPETPNHLPLAEDLPFPKEMPMTIPTKNELIESWSSWLDQNNDAWFYLTLTLVFDRNQVGLNREFCEAEYRLRILPKFQRRVERDQSRWTKALPFASDLFYYEKDETSIYKRISSGSPHHIHGLLVIPKNRLYRIWSTEAQCLDEKLQKDLNSLTYVSDWLVEPAADGKLAFWFRYITKGGKQL
jgi:hypothetical protein